MLEAGQQIGRYKISSFIGAGGMGEIYLAVDTALDRYVALKILPSLLSQDEERMRRFVLEAKSASALNHPNIITIYEIGEIDNTHFIATEYIQGETLRERINKNSLQLNDILDIAIQISTGLQAAHNANIVHRDVKPENVIIRPDGLVKILDFGLAKLIEKNTEIIDAEVAVTIKGGTNSGMVIGTVAYMSPEQAEGKKIDARSDIFSFGVVLYEMLCGRQPFTGETMIKILVAITEKAPPPLPNFLKDYPVELEGIIYKALAKNKEERYQTISDLVVDLRQLKRRLEFEDELNRNLPNEQTEIKKQIFNVVAKSNPLTITPTIAPNNLTGNPLPIVGREKEIKEICNLLQSETVRLVTMTGIGGTGKTTLAKAVAHRMLSEFADGVFCIELAAVTNSELVASTIAQSIGINEAGAKPILEVLKDYFCDKTMLLIVDNFEQVADAAKQIAELLANSYQLKILITSRMLLRLSSESEFIVPPLSLPIDSTQLSMDELLKYEAIKLFVERAQSAKPSFALTIENVQSVVEICRRLDGLPLAIELAAARVKILSPNAILSKLEKSLKVLTGGAQDLPARQQTMRGAVEWSYYLLSEDEKQLFRRISIFAGGFTFEAAEEICSDYESDEEEIEVLELITSLVNKSLVVSKEQVNSDLRFRLLEVVREYALEALEASGEIEAMRRSHAEYFLALGEEAEQHLQGAESVKWLNRLEDEHDNLRNALAWLLENDAVKAARLAAAIRGFWIFRSHVMEGRKWLKAALGCGSKAAAPVRFKLLNALGLLARNQGDYDTARKVYGEGLAAGRAENDLRQIAMSSGGLGAVAYQQDDFAAARKFYEEGLAINRELDNKSDISYSLNFLGDLARAEGNYGAARLLFEESLAIVRKLSNKQLVIDNLNSLGAVAYCEFDFAAARLHFAEGIMMAQELGDKRQISYFLDGFAALAVEQGDAERAAKLTGAAEQLRESIGCKIELAELHFRDAYTAELKTKMDEADFAEACRQGSKMKLKKAIALALD